MRKRYVLNLIAFGITDAVYSGSLYMCLALVFKAIGADMTDQNNICEFIEGGLRIKRGMGCANIYYEILEVN